jgi:hypothetical protein
MAVGSAMWGGCNWGWGHGDVDINVNQNNNFNTNIERIDKALLRKGRMIAKYKFAPLSPIKTAALAKKLGHENINGSLSLADIFGLDKPGFEQPTKKAIGFS